MNELLTMFSNSVKLFLTGKLFRDYRPVFTLSLIGFVIALLLIFLLTRFVDFWLGAILGGAISGALMPYLFKDLKYN